jgi:hypothetical protein
MGHMCCRNSAVEDGQYSTPALATIPVWYFSMWDPRGRRGYSEASTRALVGFVGFMTDPARAADNKAHKIVDVAFDTKTHAQQALLHMRHVGVPCSLLFHAQAEMHGSGTVVVVAAV